MAEVRRDLDRLLPVIVTALAVATASWASNPYAVGVFHDDGVYAILGKSIATGQGYRFLHLPGAPAASHYPPGYPLLLALVWKFAPSFPENVPAFLFLNALLLGVAAFGVYWFANEILDWPRRWAAVIALVATLSTPLLMLSTLVLSEPMFAALLFPVVVGAERLVRDDGDPRRITLVALGLALLALVRTHAIALTIALLVALAIRRRWRTALRCGTITAATLVPWQLWLMAHPGSVDGQLSGSYGSYSAWLFDGASGGGFPFIAKTILLNAREIGALLADHFALTDGNAARNIASVLAAALTILGAWRAAKRAPVFVAFAIAYLMILLVWPFTPWRFVYAVWPAVILFIAEAIGFVAAWQPTAKQRVGRWAFGLVIALICIGALREEGRAYSLRSWSRPGRDATAQIEPLLHWVVARTNTKDVLAVDGEQLVFLFTGRRAVPVAPFTAAEYVRPRSTEQNAESLRQLIRDVPVDYIATISPGLRSSGELLVAATADAPINPGGVKVVRLAPLAAGEAFRVDRAVRLAR